ncbi:MAG TPA: prolipoprotein diacylglyceryl transferase family protein [Planctomycetaceae bacterium]|nr:prolipoprotein diacylglyceryl transferase family protein [Planctomycetaceae bacterium]
MSVPALFPLIMVSALVAGVALSQRRQARLALTTAQRWAVGLGAFCGGMLGSKLPFALADTRGAFCVQAWISDGKTILFGLAGGYIGVEVAKALTDVRTKTGDAFAVPVAVSIGIGRLGCFVGRCCYGVPTVLPWGIDFGDGIRRHPTQLYEIAFHFALALALIAIERCGWFPRQRFKLYLLAYCGFRLLTEFLRPEVPIAFGLTGYQWASLAFVPIIALLWWQDRTPATAFEHDVALPMTTADRQ